MGAVFLWSRVRPPWGRKPLLWSSQSPCVCLLPALETFHGSGWGYLNPFPHLLPGHRRNQFPLSSAPIWPHTPAGTQAELATGLNPTPQPVGNDSESGFPREVCSAAPTKPVYNLPTVSLTLTTCPEILDSPTCPFPVSSSRGTQTNDLLQNEVVMIYSPALPGKCLQFFCSWVIAHDFANPGGKGLGFQGGCLVGRIWSSWAELDLLG